MKENKQTRGTNWKGGKQGGREGDREGGIGEKSRLSDCVGPTRTSESGHKVQYKYEYEYKWSMSISMSVV